MVMCDWNGCKKKAIGGFYETEDSSSSTATGKIAISETYWCADHETMMSQNLYGKPGDWKEF